MEKQPQITYRRAKSLKDRLVQSHYNVSVLSPMTPGSFSFGKCDHCRFMLNSDEIVLPNDQIHRIRHRVTCQTPGIVYLMKWTCRHLTLLEQQGHTCHCRTPGTCDMTDGYSILAMSAVDGVSLLPFFLCCL